MVSLVRIPARPDIRNILVDGRTIGAVYTVEDGYTANVIGHGMVREDGESKIFPTPRAAARAALRVWRAPLTE